eukprot:s1504_g10.t1
MAWLIWCPNLTISMDRKGVRSSDAAPVIPSDPVMSSFLEACAGGLLAVRRFAGSPILLCPDGHFLLVFSSDQAPALAHLRRGL